MPNDRLKQFSRDVLEHVSGNYDPSERLIGNYPHSIYTEEYKKTFFRLPLGEHALHSYRKSLAYALMLLLGGGTEGVKRALEILERFAETGVDRKTGALFWFAEETKLRDGNGSFFSGLPLFLIVRHFPDAIPEGLRGKLSEILRNLYPVYARGREERTFTYVNPTLADFTMCALLAGYFRFDSFADDLRKFRNYSRFLREQGVNELFSPTYYGVDLVILAAVETGSENPEFRAEAKELTEKIFLAQLAFFGSRFPVPFRRGYNGFYRTEQTGFLPYLAGWSDQCEADWRDPYMLLMFPASLLLRERAGGKIEFPNRTDFPRTMETPLLGDCRAYSHLDRKYSLGSFNFFPPVSAVWQCVTTGGCGWQDGPFYLTVENESKTSCVLQLDAADAEGQVFHHPYEGDFDMRKVARLYPFRSFPPEPKLRCLQRGGAALLLFKTDRIDAELKYFGFRLHISRFNGTMERIGEKILLDSGGGVWILAIPLRRVDMGNSTLAKGAFFPPEFAVSRNGETLDLAMPHYDGEAKGFVQNHVCGGFFLNVFSGKSVGEVRAYAEETVVSDCFESDRINAHIDSRDAIRKVRVETPEGVFLCEWNHYSDESFHGEFEPK